VVLEGPPNKDGYFDATSPKRFNFGALSTCGAATDLGSSIEDSAGFRGAGAVNTGFTAIGATMLLFVISTLSVSSGAAWLLD